MNLHDRTQDKVNEHDPYKDFQVAYLHFVMMPVYRNAAEVFVSPSIGCQELATSAVNFRTGTGGFQNGVSSGRRRNLSQRLWQRPAMSLELD